MADIDLGKVKQQIRSPYLSSSTYEEGDVVYYKGGWYIAIKNLPSSDIPPTIQSHDSNFPSAKDGFPLRYGAYGERNNFHLNAVGNAQDNNPVAVDKRYWRPLAEAFWEDHGGISDWADGTYYHAGAVVRRAEVISNAITHYHTFYCIKDNYGDDPLTNHAGSWEVQVHGGGRDFTNRITHMMSQQPISWRGHPYLTMPNWGTGTTNPWMGNIPPRLSIHGANAVDGFDDQGQRAMYNDAVGNAGFAPQNGLHGIRWDGTPVQVTGMYEGSYNYTGNNGASQSPVMMEKPWAYTSAIRATWRTYQANDNGEKKYPNEVTNKGNRNTINSFEGSAEEALDHFQSHAKQDNYLGTLNFNPHLPRAISFMHYYGIGVLFDDGTIEMKGSNGANQYTGDSTTEYYDSGTHLGPSIFGGKKIVKVVQDSGNENGSSAVCALDEEGEVWMWGDNSSRQCGIGPEAGVTGRASLGLAYDDNTNVQQPVNLMSDLCFEGNKVVDVYGGGGPYGMFAAIDTAGNLWTWGDGQDGSLGYATNSGFTTAGYCAVPNKIDVDWSTYGGIQKIEIAGGNNENYLVVLDGEGQIWNCGDNSAGALGTGNTTNTGTSGTITRRTGWTGLSGSIVNFWTTGYGSYQNCWFQHSDGTFWGVGDNSEYQLGTGNTTDQYTPVQIPDITYVVKMSGSLDDDGNLSPYLMALDKNGVCWGFGNYHLAGLGAGNGDAGTNGDLMQLDGEDRYGPKRMRMPLQCWKYGVKNMIAQHAYWGQSGGNYSSQQAYILTWAGHLLRSNGDARWQKWNPNGNHPRGGTVTHSSYNN